MARFLYNGFAASTFGAKIEIDTGPGSSTINLGAFNDSLGEVSGNIVADEGSSITGEDITLFVNTHADLRAASLDGITQIIMDDDSSLFAGRAASAMAASPRRIHSWDGDTPDDDSDDVKPLRLTPRPPTSPA